jgi:hypothetical protein
MARLVALLCAAAALLPPGPARAGRLRVVLAFENRSSNRAAVHLAATSLTGILARKGYEAIDSAEVSDFLEAMGVTRLDPMPPGVVNKLLLRFHADGVLSVVINYMLEARPRSRGPRASPAVGITARLVGFDDRLVWRNSLGLLADDVVSSSSSGARTGGIGMTISKGTEQLLFTLPKSRRSRPDEEVASEKAAVPTSSAAARRGGPRFPLAGPGSVRPSDKDDGKGQRPRKLQRGL